jgi:hypothetical protein
MYEYEIIDNFDDESDPDQRIKFDTGHSDMRFIAEDAATVHYNDHDGWESSWPQIFAIYEDNKKLGEYSVDLCFQPLFSCSERK